MTEVGCQKCGKLVDVTLAKCPHCRADTSVPPSGLRWGWIATGVAAWCGAVLFMAGLALCDGKQPSTAAAFPVPATVAAVKPQAETSPPPVVSANSDGLRAHPEAAVDETNQAITKARALLAVHDWTAAKSALVAVKGTVDSYDRLSPPVVQMAEPLRQIHEIVEDFDKIEAVLAELAGGPGHLAEATSKIGAGEYLAADKIFETLLSNLIVNERRDNLLSSSGLKKFRDTVAARRRAIAGKVERQRKAERKAEAAREAEEAARRLVLEICGGPPKVFGYRNEIAGQYQDVGQIDAVYFLKKLSGDPDSVQVRDCTAPMMVPDHCWVSSCNIRGQNAFGAVVLRRMMISYGKAYGFTPLE